MATGVLQIENPNGGCCDCGLQSGCGCGSLCSLKCRSVAGGAVFCGYDEFGTPSALPLYYQTATLSGSSIMTCSTDGMGCTNDDQCQQTFTYGGKCSIDPATCLETANGGLTISGSCADTVTVAACDVSAALLGTLNGVECEIDNVYFQCPNCPQPYSQHTLSCPYPGTCRTSGSGFTGCVCPNPQVVCVLTDLDTIDQAISRSVGGSPNYTENSMGACAANSSFVTPWSSPSKTFSFRKGQFQVTLPSTIVGKTYEVKVIYEERAAGTSGPFTPYGLDEISITASGITAVSPWIDIPLEGGLEIIPSSCTVTGSS